MPRTSCRANQLLVKFSFTKSIEHRGSQRHLTKTNEQRNKAVLTDSQPGMFLACSSNLGKSQPQRSYKKGVFIKKKKKSVFDLPLAAAAANALVLAELADKRDLDTTCFAACGSHIFEITLTRLFELFGLAQRVSGPICLVCGA